MQKKQRDTKAGRKSPKKNTASSSYKLSLVLRKHAASTNIKENFIMTSSVFKALLVPAFLFKVSQGRWKGPSYPGALIQAPVRQRAAKVLPGEDASWCTRCKQTTAEMQKVVTSPPSLESPSRVSTAQGCCPGDTGNIQHLLPQNAASPSEQGNKTCTPCPLQAAQGCSWEHLPFFPGCLAIPIHCIEWPQAAAAQSSVAVTAREPRGHRQL